jgi:hypothetical protein
VEFVLRYTSDVGYFQPLGPEDPTLPFKIIQRVVRRISNPVPLTADTVKAMKKALEWASMLLGSGYEDGMERLTASKQFNDALEFSSVAKGICNNDELPNWLKDIPAKERSRVVRQHFKDLKKRDPKKFRYLLETPIRDMIHPRAYEAVETPERILKVKAEKLRLNMPSVTRAALAHELKISRATLYRQYELDDIRRGCKPPAPVAPGRTAAKKKVTINYKGEPRRDQGVASARY